MVVAIAQKTGAHLRERRLTRQAGENRKKLSSASGAHFDRLFLSRPAPITKDSSAELQQEREDASDDDIEALIDKIVPILQQHQDLAQILMKKEQA